MAETVILVDEADRPLGAMEKIAAHRDGGRLHRAFSILLFSLDGQWLLQQRAPSKYHFPSLWTNACCSHPRPGEATADAAARRLREELGLSLPLAERFSFTYRAPCPAQNLAEWEFDHVFTATLPPSLAPAPDPAEVAALRWLSPADLAAEIAAAPQTFTPWFLHIWQEVNQRKIAAPSPQPPSPQPEVERSGITAEIQPSSPPPQPRRGERPLPGVERSGTPGLVPPTFQALKGRQNPPCPPTGNSEKPKAIP